MPQSKAQIAATRRYNQKTYDKLFLRIRKDSSVNIEQIKEHVSSRGESLNGFILRAIYETMLRDDTQAAKMI